MKINTPFNRIAVAAAFLSIIASGAHAQELINNGGFESGFTGWTITDQTGGDGTFALQSGTSSPVNAFDVPAPPEGVQAAMTDSGSAGSHILYQDFIVPVMPVVNLKAVLSYSLFVNSGDNFFTPASLDFAGTSATGSQNLNQQARVDIISALADPFSVQASDVLQNVYRTKSGDPLTSGYNDLTINISAVLAAHQGETLRLRFAEVDNVSFLNFGVDRVSLVVTTAPEPSSLPLLLTAGLGILGIARARRRK